MRIRVNVFTSPPGRAVTFSRVDQNPQPGLQHARRSVVDVDIDLAAGCASHLHVDLATVTLAKPVAFGLAVAEALLASAMTLGLHGLALRGVHVAIHCDQIFRTRMVNVLYKILGKMSIALSFYRKSDKIDT